MRNVGSCLAPRPRRPPVERSVTRLILFLIAVYKRLLSPLLGKRCRFHPTCSEYARIAVVRFGPLRGSALAAWRLLRCQPLCDGGLDPVPSTFTLTRCRSHRKSSEDT